MKNHSYKLIYSSILRLVSSSQKHWRGFSTDFKSVIHNSILLCHPRCQPVYMFQDSQGSLSCRVLLRVMLVMFTSASSSRLVKWWCRVVRTCSLRFGALSRESVPSHYQVTAWLSQTLTSSTRARISYQSASLYLLNLSLCTLTALLDLQKFKLFIIFTSLFSKYKVTCTVAF